MKKGERLKELMLKRGITAEEFAPIIGVSVSSVFKYYNKDNFDSDLLEKFCSELKVPVNYFFDESVQQTSRDQSVLVGGNNNGKINLDSKQKLDAALSEVKFLKAELDNKNKLLEEKERLINVLLKK